MPNLFVSSRAGEGLDLTRGRVMMHVCRSRMGAMMNCLITEESLSFGVREEIDRTGPSGRLVAQIFFAILVYIRVSCK
jgi:hypothetical protein